MKTFLCSGTCSGSLVPVSRALRFCTLLGSDLLALGPGYFPSVSHVSVLPHSLTCCSLVLRTLLLQGPPPKSTRLPTHLMLSFPLMVFQTIPVTGIGLSSLSKKGRFIHYFSHLLGQMNNGQETTQGKKDLLWFLV